MHEEIANIVHPVLARGLDLRERLLRGEEPTFENEQAALLGMLLSEREARRLPEYGGENPDIRSASEEPGHGPFLGARYALTCWLDELFVLDSPWSQRWNEQKMEVRLYSSNDRAWRFWDQARYASDKGLLDALEVYFLCVMLGFTGEKIEDSTGLVDWLNATRRQLRGAGHGMWKAPPGLEPGTHVPPLRGRESLQRMLLVTTGVLLATVPIVAFFLARRFTG